MISQDALDHCRKPMSYYEKISWAKKKHEEEITVALQDRKMVKKLSLKFEEKINADRKRLGL